MAKQPPRTKEEIEKFMAEELDPGSHGRSQAHVVAEEMKEHGSQSLGAPQQQQKLDPKAANFAAVWNTAATQSQKMGPELPTTGMSREAGHGGGPPQEYPGSFQGMRFLYERNLEADLITEISLEELNELEIEVMRRQLHVITGRLRALENEGATWRHRETLIFTMLLSTCIASLWLWMRQ
ncbi:fetal and adult testis-expressed transcript protein [Hippopotamus amphibius kiboko]|uniref:fetal and adult testis-expressed transcript protein n=1 Tax=Hippopotamus amphibius kiboko TaxID=575201 RepID=UPI0025960117|nr:fetal and adult testis-expressed transcript protein [Hippopotamus amphibius kiboko]